MTVYFIQAFIYLCAAVVAVPIAKRLGLGSVLGYLIAGVIIGPVTGIVGSETVAIQHFAEFGVVMMLFLVGLELDPRKLWEIRNRLIGLGGLQLGLTTAATMGLALAFGQPWSIALALGLIFSLSSTAIVLQTFSEKRLTKTEGGETAFSVLLFQDIAVIPMLALIPLLAMPELVQLAADSGQAAQGHHDDVSLVAGLSGFGYAGVVIAAVAFVVAGGHFLSRPLFRFVAKAELREIFTATALLLVIGIAALMSLVGLSPALGTFLAGLVMANSEFRHELESNIEPFKGLLLGLFFITVGAGIDFNILKENALLVLGLTIGIMAIKAIVLYLLGLIFKVKGSNRWLLTLSLAQAGEFGFVLLAFSNQNHVLPPEMVGVLSLVVAFSMFLTPGLFIAFDKVIIPLYQKSHEQRNPDQIDETGPVIIAGIGRFGQIVNRFLVANGIPTVVLDHQAGQVDLMRRINIKSFFGDASQPDILHTAGIHKASLLVIAIDDQERVMDLVKYAKHSHPNLKVLVRAFDRRHTFQLKQIGADFIISETYLSALEMGKVALTHMGVHPFRAEQLQITFDEMDARHREELFNSWLEGQEGKEETRFDNYRKLFMQLEATMSHAMDIDRTEKHSRTARGWTPPPKNYIKGFKGDASEAPKDA